MKNKKLLMPLAGVAALGAVSPIVVMATSCGEKADASVKSIEASVEWPAVYVGNTINKTDVHVIANMASGVTQDLDPSEWTCSEIGDSGYTFKAKGWKTFDIAYKGHHTTLEIYAALNATFFFSTIPFNLIATDNLHTAQKLHVYASTIAEEELHEVDLSVLKVTSSDPTVLDYDEATGSIVAKKTGNATITVEYKEDSSFTKTSDSISVSNSTSQTLGGIDSAGNAYITPLSTASTGIFVVPDYVVNNTELVPVTHLTKGDTDYVPTLIMPSTITNIEKELFATTNKLMNVFFNGTKTQWNRITAGNNWAGIACIGAYCVGQDEPEFVYFSGCQYSTYNETDTEKYFMTEKAVGRADLIPGHYTVAFDLAASSLAAADLKKFTKIELINSSRLSGLNSLEIENIYLVDANYWNTTELTLGDDYSSESGATRYLHTYTFSTDSGKGADNFDAYTRLIIKFKTPATSLNSVNVKLSYVSE